MRHPRARARTEARGDAPTRVTGVANLRLVYVSHREIGITVEGPAATLVLSALRAPNLEAMPDGSATRTILDKAQAVLVKHDAQRYRIEVWQSFADHVWTLLAAVSNEIRLDI